MLGSRPEPKEKINGSKKLEVGKCRTFIVNERLVLVAMTKCQRKTKSLYQLAYTFNKRKVISQFVTRSVAL